jgi:hypothetical protein
MPVMTTRTTDPLDPAIDGVQVPFVAHIGSAQSKLIGPLLNDKPLWNPARQRRMAKAFVLKIWLE